jgi:acyl-protein synthetase LuxE
MGEDFDRLIALEQYSLADGEKSSAMLAGLNALTGRHLDQCIEYARIVEAAHLGTTHAARLVEVPYLPVSLFKWLDLRSVPHDAVFKVMTSSGTTGQVPSRVYLDVGTARAQTRALSSIVTNFLGPKRRSMLIVDDAGVIADRRKLSARGAGILGMMSYGRDHLFALDADMHLDRPPVEAWLARHAGEELLIFGFTSMIWQHLYEEAGDFGLDLSRAVLVHSGGWKKLADQAVTNEIFKARLHRAFGIERVHDFYGMVEQVGSVFFECEAGNFHTPNFADVLVRDPDTWQLAPNATPGVMEVLSLIPESYPGHALLTEDVGTVMGVDDCPCGRLGRRFVISGRIPKAEVRGCSDTYERPRA